VRGGGDVERLVERILDVNIAGSGSGSGSGSVE